MTEIANFNSQFSWNYNIDRTKLVKIISSKYKENIISCTFDPQYYQGINIKYKSKIENSTDFSKQIKNNKKCDSDLSNTTILIFQTGNVIINGSKIWDKNMEAYNFILTLLNTEKDNIIIQNNNKIIYNKIPSIIEDNDNVYLNFYELIFKSPRNVRLLKLNNLYDVYKEKYLLHSNDNII